MDVDFNMYDNQEQLLKPPSLQDWQSFSSAHSFSDTQSLSSTLFEEQAAIAVQQQQQQHPYGAHPQHNMSLSWGELSHFSGQHPQG